MATLKGVALSVRLDAFKIEQAAGGPKASLRTSLFAEFDRKTNKAQYNRVIFTTKSKTRIEQLAALELPEGRLDQQTVIHLTIPYANLHFSLWQGPNGPGLTGWAYIDGEVSVAIPSPKPARQDGRDGRDHSQPVRPPQRAAATAAKSSNRYPRDPWWS